MRTLGRTRRPRISARLWTVLVVVVSMVATVPIHAQLPFGFLHGGSIKKDSKAETDKAFANKCFQCETWDHCWIGNRYIAIPRAVVYSEWLWDAILVFAATFEVLVRGFTLGFGIRMLNYLFWEPHNGTKTTNHASESEIEPQKRARFVKSLSTKALVSAVAGLSLAAFLHGSSIVFPAHVRQEWFHYHRVERNGLCTPPKTLPLALYRYIERTIFPNSLDADGSILVCPSRCTDEFCNQTYTEIRIDSIAYASERMGAGLVFLTATLEVLLRGFSLGFGAMMLNFLFVRTQNGEGESPGERNTKRSESSPGVVDQDEVEEWTDLVQTFRHRALVSSLAGISTAAVIHGSSLFVPIQVRNWWIAGL